MADQIAFEPVAFPLEDEPEPEELDAALPRADEPIQQGKEARLNGQTAGKIGSSGWEEESYPTATGMIE